MQSSSPESLSVAQGQKPRTSNALDALLERRASIALKILLVVFFVVTILTSLRKPIWADEVFTGFLALQPDWKHFLGAMPVEGNPPLSSLLTAFSIRVFGLSAFSLRLPQMLGMTGALALLYSFVKRELSPLYGLLAVTLVLSQPIWKYSFEARPYGLLMLFLTLLLVSWQRAADPKLEDSGKRRTKALALIAVSVAGCILSHNIGIVTVAVLMTIGEGVRSFRRKRIDWGVAGAILVGSLAFATTLPMIHRTKMAVFTHVYVIGPPYSLSKLLHYTSRMRETLFFVMSWRVVLALFVLSLGCAVVHALFGKIQANERPTHHIPAHLWAAAFGLFLLIPATWLAMIPAGGWYYSRYGMGTVLGCSILACFVLFSARVHRYLVVEIAATSILFFGYSAATFKPQFPVDKGFLAQLQRGHDSTPVIIAEPFDYPALLWNATDKVGSRLTYLTDTGGSELIEAALSAEQPYWQLDKWKMHAHVEHLAPYLTTHDHFLVLCANVGPRCLVPYQKSGYSTKLIEPSRQLYDLRRETSPAN